jgi:hypothetical protein
LEFYQSTVFGPGPIWRITDDTLVDRNARFFVDTNLDVQELEFTKIAQASGTALISHMNDVLDLAKLLKKFLMYSGGSFERLVILKVPVIVDSTIETLHVHSFYGQS